MKPTPRTRISTEITEVVEPDHKPTTELAPLKSYMPPSTFDEILSQGPSEIGFSAVSQYLACPEKARLQASGIRPKTFRPAGPLDLLDDPLAFGSCFHALDATRTVWGMDGANYLLNEVIKLAIDAASYRKLSDMLRAVNFTFPVEKDEFEILAVEQEIWTDVRSLDRRQPRVRSVRYDKIVRYKRGDVTGVYSRELKTSRTSGESVTRGYTPQAAVQSMIWNENEALVKRYGIFRGTIFEVVTKANVPSAHRYGPFNFAGWPEQIAKEYMALPEEIEYPVNSDGTYPKMIHECWGKYGKPCPNMALCWQNAQGEYTTASHGE